MIELQNFGWNYLTFNFIATIFFSLLAMWWGYRQGENIWRKKSGEAVSHFLHICNTGYFFVRIVYGVHLGSIAVAFSGFARAPIQIYILVGLAKHNGFKWSDKSLLFILCATLLLMIMSPWKGLIFEIVSYTALASLAAQPVKIWRQKTRGSVTLGIQLVYVFSSLVWIAYALEINDIRLLAVHLVAFVIFTVTTILWFAYPTK